MLISFKYFGPVKEIVAGYKTDAERAAIDFAGSCAISNSGYSPAGYVPKYRSSYKCLLQAVQENDEIEYIKKNIDYADGTVYFSSREASDQIEILKKIANIKLKPFTNIDLSHIKDLDACLLIRKFCNDYSIRRLHISGSSVQSDETYAEVENILRGISELSLENDLAEQTIAAEEIAEELGDLEASAEYRSSLEIIGVYSKIQSEIDELSHYYKVLTDEIEKRRNELFTETGVPYAKIYDPIGWDSSYHEHEANIPHHLRVSMIIVLCSKLEEWLDNICNSIKKKKRIAATRHEIKEKSLMRVFQRYLAQYGEFKIPGENDWKIIEAIYLLRNIFVHNAGLMPRTEYKTEMIDLLRAQNEGLHINDRVAYEKQRQMMIIENNKMQEEKSKIEIKTLTDLRRSLEMNHYFFDVPPPLGTDTIFEERIYLQRGFSEFAIKKVNELIAAIKSEHEKLYTKLHRVK